MDTRDHSGATARMLAKQYGHMKIVGLIDAHSPTLPKNLYRSPGICFCALCWSSAGREGRGRKIPPPPAPGPSSHLSSRDLALAALTGDLCFPCDSTVQSRLRLAGQIGETLECRAVPVRLKVCTGCRGAQGEVARRPHEGDCLQFLDFACGAYCHVKCFNFM